MSDFTPGPWMFWPDCGEIIAPNGDDRPILVAQVWGDDEVSDEQCDANGNVLGASLDMLAALEAHVEAEDLCAHMKPEWAPTFAIAMDLTRTAIAKAKGEVG